MISYGYNIVDSFIISLNLNCIMQLKHFYHIATKDSCRKNVILLLVIYLTANVDALNDFAAAGEMCYQRW